ncbi:sugar transferase [Bacteroides thetaiotaomicron]|uniref:Sugar transferase n=1 Tax=Bacteroides thetaiotaomicron TaxID=818 RepID=A0A943DTU5_BACT4|nr:sugar transferase [Bacteroides thetaiotaomicron]MBS5413075.1 sugar transferase [Bacteroides thetaiotaomicron]MCE8953665.1 sugar transferase [Bacteroides thetaiotaomicron]MCE8971172.1 sugar transferase [Bacteroides thetaiotaomicron]
MIRFLDIFFSFCGLLLLMPVFLILYLFIRIESKGPGFYSQIRVGKGGKDFRLYKFRSMRVGADKKGLITVGGRDSRITRVGYFIRKYKLDELPQLWNVLLGDMSLVGPRPEVRKYVDIYTEDQWKVLSVRPGITDYASIEYVDENEILGKAIDPDKVYVEQIMPDKIRYNMKYIQSRSVFEYFKVIILTILHVVR